MNSPTYIPLKNCTESCCVLDYVSPLTEYRPFAGITGLASLLPIGGVVDTGDVVISPLIPAVGDETTFPIEFGSGSDCPIPAEITVLRLTAGGTLTFDSSSTAIRNIGAGDYTITIRVLPDRFGNVISPDWMLNPSQMGGNQERFVIQAGIHTPADDYVQGGGAPNLTPPINAVVWGNNNNTAFSSFRYTGYQEISFRMNGQNAVSNLVAISLLNGPTPIQLKSICDFKNYFFDHFITPSSASDDDGGNTGGLTPTLPPNTGSLTVFNFQDGESNNNFNLQVGNQTNTPVNWEVLLQAVPYSSIPSITTGNYTMQVAPNGSNFDILFTGTSPINAFNNITITGGQPSPVGVGTANGNPQLFAS